MCFGFVLVSVGFSEEHRGKEATRALVYEGWRSQGSGSEYGDQVWVESRTFQ